MTYQLSVKYTGDSEYTEIATFPTYVSARWAVFDSVALAGGHIVGLHETQDFADIVCVTTQAEIMTITADRECMDYIIKLVSEARTEQ